MDIPSTMAEILGTKRAPTYSVDLLFVGDTSYSKGRPLTMSRITNILRNIDSPSTHVQAIRINGIILDPDTYKAQLLLMGIT